MSKKNGIYICGHCGSLNHHSCGSDICECAAQGHVPSIELARRMAGGLIVDLKDNEARERVTGCSRLVPTRMTWSVS